MDFKYKINQNESRTPKSILDAADPLRGSTPSDIFFYVAFGMLEHDRRGRGLEPTFDLALAIYDGRKHTFLYDDEIAGAIDGAKLKAEFAAAGPEPDVTGPSADYMKYARKAEGILRNVVNDIRAPAFFFKAGALLVTYNDALLLAGFPLPSAFREVFERTVTGDETPIARPKNINLAGDVILQLTGKAPALGTRGRLAVRGRKGIKSPEYQAARATDMPLVTPEITGPGLIMFLYQIAYTGLIIRGEAGIYDDGDTYYARKHELYEIVGGELDKRTRRAGMVDLTTPRQTLAGYQAGQYVEYIHRPGGTLTKIIHIDNDDVRFAHGYTYKGFRWNPLYHTLIHTALTYGGDRGESRAVRGGNIVMPTARLDAVLANARKRGDKNYGGLALGFIDVLRNRKKPEYIRSVDVLLEILRMAGYKAEGQSMNQARDALRAKLDIYGESEIIECYDIQGDKVKIVPNKILAPGETGDLFPE